jgi:hypothetical protein
MPYAKTRLERVRHSMGTKCAAIIALLGAVLCGVCQASHVYPRIGNFYSGPVGQQHCEILSQWDLVVLGSHVPEGSPDAIPILRSLNPDIKILAYFPVAGVWTVCDTIGSIGAGYCAKIEACDWYLYDNKGNVVGDSVHTWFVNFTTKSSEDPSGLTVDEWLIDYLVDEIFSTGLWDGALFDIFSEDPSWINNWEHMFRDPPALIDADRDGAGDDPDSLYAWSRTAIDTFLNSLRQRIGPSYILVGNGKNYFSQYLNGGIREDFPTRHGDWEANMFSPYGYLTMCRDWLDYPINATLMFCTWRDESNSLYEPDREGRYERYVRFSITSALLGDGYYCLYGGRASLWWEDYYDLDLGLPTSEAYLDSIFNSISGAYSPVWRRDFENADIYCNPYDICISNEDLGWLSPEDGLIKTHQVPCCVDVEIAPANSTREFDQRDRHMTYRATVSNNSENAVFAEVWADLSKNGTPVISGRQISYLVGAQDSVTRDRYMRLPPGLPVGTYTLEVMVGGPDFAEVSRDTLTVSRVLRFDTGEFKHPKPGDGGYIRIFPQPVVSHGSSLRMEVNPGSGEQKFCSVKIYDAGGRLLQTVFAGALDQGLDLEVDLRSNVTGRLAPGVYFVSARLGDERLTKKVVLLRGR